MIWRGCMIVSSTSSEPRWNNMSTSSPSDNTEKLVGAESLFEQDWNPSFEWQRHFMAAYTVYRETYFRAHALSCNELETIEAELLKAAHRYRTALYIVSCVLTVFSLAMICVLASVWMSHLNLIGLWLTRGLLSSTRPGALKLLLGSCGLLTFYSLMPFALRGVHPALPLTLIKRVLAPVIGVGGGAMRLFSVLSGYIFLLPLALFLADRMPNRISVAPLVLGCWLAIPTFVLIFVGSAILSIAVTDRKIESIVRPAALYRSARRLMKLLAKLHCVESSMLTVSDREYIANEIFSAAHTIADLYGKGGEDVRDWARARLLRAASDLRQLVAWVYFPQSGTVQALEAKLIEVVNVMLSGNLHDLDGILKTGFDPEYPSPKTARWRSLSLHALMAVYFLFPLVSFALLENRWHIQIAGLAQSVAALLYLLWVVVGFFAFSDSISSESRALLADVIRTVAGRKG
jgi:hypothetical protein